MKDVIISAAEKQRAAQLFEVRRTAYGGKGVFARRNIKDSVLVGTYPGTVYTDKQYAALVKKHPRFDTHAVDFWGVEARTGRIQRTYVITPGSTDGSLVPRFADAVTPYLNEPLPGRMPNAFWVWNLAKHVVEVHTYRRIPAGEEVCICYGNMYARSYPTACTSLRPKDIMALHYRLTPRGRLQVFPNGIDFLPDRQVSEPTRALALAPRTPPPTALKAVRVVKPTRAEQADDAKLVEHGPGGVVARQNIPPFTRVAVCFGRVLSTQDHSTLFGSADRWQQWTFVRKGAKALQGFVVTPARPGGSGLDPAFSELGAFPHFKPAPACTEPECVYVLNFAHNRLEYWTGRRGARAGQPLRLSYDSDKTTFPVIYVYDSNMAKPLSVHELAVRAPSSLALAGFAPDLIRVWALQGGST